MLFELPKDQSLSIYQIKKTLLSEIMFDFMISEKISLRIIADVDGMIARV